MKGLIKVYLQTGYDKQINISLAGTGDFLAFSAVFGENIHNYSAQALKDSVICMIEKESLKKILLEQSAICAGNYFEKLPERTTFVWHN